MRVGEWSSKQWLCGNGQLHPGQLAGILHEISSKKIMGNLKTNCICRLIPSAFFLSL